MEYSHLVDTLEVKQELNICKSWQDLDGHESHVNYCMDVHVIFWLEKDNGIHFPGKVFLKYAW